MPLTKAARVSEMYDNFSVSACKYTGSWDGLQSPDFMYDVTVSRSGTPSRDYYWPGASYKLRFFAYAPKETAYVLSAQAEGIPTLHCAIPQEVEKQKDLLVAASDEIAGDADAAVRLRFRHALTAVRFVCGEDVQVGMVKSVTLRNVYSKASYDLNLERWSGWGTKASFSQTLNKTVGAGQPITEEAQTFMMLPQTLPDNAEIEVIFNDGTKDHTLNAPIGKAEWPKGKTVTYRISTSSINWEYFLEVTSPKDFTYEGGTKSYRVTSYRKNSGGTIEPVAWEARFSEDGTTWSDEMPVWLTEFTASGAGGNTATTYKATIARQVGITANRHNDALKAMAPIGSMDAPYNLANSSGAATVENTANCYVVGAPGVYSFPLVYGNAIKNGEANRAAYTSTVSGRDILNPFINHLGNGITDPYIVNNSCVPAKAELVWQDAPSLVTDIRYNPGVDGGNISFVVDQNTIQQGNAVIAVKDAAGTVLWSWHIWVTDEDINNTIEVINHQNVRYKFMAVNLGWCDGEITDYAGRSCDVRFIAGGQTSEIRLKQLPRSEMAGGSHPYYQWGRKDPLLPSNGTANTNKTWYGANGAPSAVNPKTESFPWGAGCIKNYIIKPDVMQGLEYGDNTFLNLWSANNNLKTANDNLVVKTIYDPCPVGFKVPASNAFTGFTVSGGKESSRVNGDLDNLRKGYLFYGEPNKTGPKIFFPASGRRNWSGFLDGVSKSGYYWVAIPYGGVSNIYALTVDLSFVWPLDYWFRARGLGVRPVREE